MAEMKNRHVSDLYTTLRQRTIMLQKKISTGKKIKNITREVPVTVSEARPLELFSITTSENLSAGRFVASHLRYRVPFNLDSRFEDVAVSKIGLDAGNGSTKGICSDANVDEPQSQKHVRVFLEFSGVKDTAHNMERAAFDKDGLIRKDIETLMNRRCILFNVTVNGKTQMLVVNNINKNHDPNSPQPLPQNLSGITDHIPTQPAPKSIKFGERVADVDVSSL